MSITIEEMQKQVHALAKEKGWWPTYRENGPKEVIDLDKVNIPEKLMLMVSELGEALEEYRKGNVDTWFSVDTDPLATETQINNTIDKKPEGMWIELADVIIRLLDLAGAYDIDMEELVKLKHAYNKTRPYRHGGKKC